MKHFENNVNDGMSRTDSIETLIDLTSCIAVNALMVAGGEAEADEKDAGAWWAMIALAIDLDARADGENLLERSLGHHARVAGGVSHHDGQAPALEVERQLVDAVVALRELLGRGGAADRGIHLVGSLGKRPLDDGVVDEVLHAG